MTQIGRAVGRVTVTFDALAGIDAAYADSSTARTAVTLEWAAMTDIGRKRAHNEDSFVAEAPVFAVADGMGGHSAGDVASAAVVSRLFEFVNGEFADPSTILPALRAATADIALADDRNDLGVGTTVTGFALTRVGEVPVWTIFNIGDSRVYLLDSGVLRQLTVDHSVVQELVDSGMISRTQAETHPRRNVITRAVGFNAEPFADVWSLPVQRGTRLLVCSDGLTRELNDDQIRHLLGTAGDPAQTASALIAGALASGGQDNITAIVVDVVEVSDVVGPGLSRVSGDSVR